MHGSNSSTAKLTATVGTCIALGSFVLFAILNRVGVLPINFGVGMVETWSMFLFVVLWATRMEGLSLSSLGFKRPTAGTVGWALVAVISIYVFFGIYYRMIAPLFGGVVTVSYTHLTLPTIYSV